MIKKQIAAVLAMIAVTTCVTLSMELRDAKKVIEEKKVKISESQKNIEIKTGEIVELKKKVEESLENNEILKKEIKEKDDKINELEEKPKPERVENVSRNENLRSVESDRGRKINVELTGYCNCTICSGNWGSQTAMGTRNRIGVVAAPKEISLGSKISIPSLSWYKQDGMFSAEDRGGAVVVKNNGNYVIDVWFPSHEQALKFGRQKTVAYIK